MTVKHVKLGKGPQCQVHLASASVLDEHLWVGWKPGQGLVARSLGPVVCDQKPLPLNENVLLPRGSLSEIYCGDTRVPMMSALIVRLYLENCLPPSGEIFRVGSDRARCNVVIDHPDIYPVHLEIDKTKKKFRVLSSKDDALNDVLWSSLEQQIGVHLENFWVSFSELNIFNEPSETTSVKKFKRCFAIDPADFFHCRWYFVGIFVTWNPLRACRTCS
jgi:hypothetical protein